MLLASEAAFVLREACTLVAVVLLWRTVWRLLDLVLPMNFDAESGPGRAVAESFVSVLLGVLLLAASGGLPRDW